MDRECESCMRLRRELQAAYELQRKMQSAKNRMEERALNAELKLIALREAIQSIVGEANVNS